MVVSRSVDGVLPLLAPEVPTLSPEPTGDGEPACRRDSVQPLRAWVAIHLSGLPGDALLSRSGRAARFPRLALLRVGFTEPIEVTLTAGALLPHRFTLTCADPEVRHRRSAFCGTVLRVTPTGR